jgi:uncharacterized membrane protein (DUF373 family)
MKNKINEIFSTFEKGVIILLVVLMGIVLLFSSLELIVAIFKEIYLSLSSATLLLDKKELVKIFGYFFNVLIGLELFETVKLYLKENIFHAEYVLLVALIAITRKVIILEYDKVDNIMLFAIAAIILVLTIGYYLLKQGQHKQFLKNKQDENNA